MELQNFFFRHFFQFIRYSRIIFSCEFSRCECFLPLLMRFEKNKQKNSLNAHRREKKNDEKFIRKKVFASAQNNAAHEEAKEVEKFISFLARSLRITDGTFAQLWCLLIARLSIKTTLAFPEDWWTINEFEFDFAPLLLDLATCERKKLPVGRAEIPVKSFWWDESSLLRPNFHPHEREEYYISSREFSSINFKIPLVPPPPCAPHS